MKSIVLLNIRLIYFFIDLLIPKRNMYLFTAKGGSEFKGNISSLYRYMEQKSKACYFVESPWSLKSIWTSLRAKTVFLSHGPGDLPYAFHSFRKNVVYLGHGITIKKMLFEEENVPLKRLLLTGMESRFYSHVIASSNKDKENLSKVFRLPEKRFFVTGLPRNDVFNNAAKSLSEVFSVSGKFVLYAPTYRRGEATNLFPFSDFDLKKLNQQLESLDTYVVIRPHPNDKGANDTLFSYPRILNGNVRELDEIQDYLFGFDGLITDYSSIYIDFLLSGKQVAFIPYDLEDYKRSTGLFFEYEDITPGPKLDTQESFEGFWPG